MKFLIVWKFKKQEKLREKLIEAKNLDEAEEYVEKNIQSNRKEWLDIVDFRYTLGGD